MPFLAVISTRRSLLCASHLGVCATLLVPLSARANAARALLPAGDIRKSTKRRRKKMKTGNNAVDRMIKK